MAFLYKRAGSPFWWIRFRDPATGKAARRSTGKRVDSTTETRAARAEEHALTSRELSIDKSDHSATRWETWAADYLRFRYSDPRQSCSRERFLGAWEHLREFLRQRKVRNPAELRREHLIAYIAARTSGAKPVAHSTARLEIMALSVLMDEAVRRGWAPSNPCQSLGIKKPKPAEKPEIPEELLNEIQKRIEAEPEPRRKLLMRSFLIARYQGCRLSETHLDLHSDVIVQGDAGTILFRIKGDRCHPAPMHPALVPHFRAWMAAGESETYPKPVGRTHLSSLWVKFFHSNGFRKRLPGICFHSLRVTAVTRLARANVPEVKCRAFIGHSSATVHRIYQRLRPSDLDACFAPLSPTGTRDALSANHEGH